MAPMVQLVEPMAATANGTTDTIDKNDRSMNDVQDNLHVDTHAEMLFLSLERCIFSHLLS